jgi:hypothetical protein
MVKKIQIEHDTFLNKVWDKTIGAFPEKAYTAGLVTLLLGLGAYGVGNSIHQNNLSEAARKADIVAQTSKYTEAQKLNAAQDSLLTLGFDFCDDEMYNDADKSLDLAFEVNSNYNPRGSVLKGEIKSGKHNLEVATAVAEARSKFDINKTTGTMTYTMGEGETLWDNVAETYWIAQNGKLPVNSEDRRSIGNYWKQMAVDIRASGSSPDTLSAGDKIVFSAYTTKE